MKRLYGLQVGALLVLLVGLAILSGIFIFGQAVALYQAEAVCGCGIASLAWWSWPAVILAIAYLVLLGNHLTRILRTQMRFHATIRMQQVALTPRLQPYADMIRTPLLLISSDHMEAFTVGFFRPQVVVSARLVDALTEKELLAVLRHEAQHAASRHPLWSLVLILAQRIIYVPQSLIEYIRFLAEREADRAAIAAAGVRALAGALAKVLHEEQHALPVTVHTFSATTLRLKRLLHEPVVLPHALFVQNAVLFLAVVALVAVIALLFSHASPVYAEVGGMCNSIPYCTGDIPHQTPAPLLLPPHASVLFSSMR